MGDADKASEIVAHVLNIFIDVPVENVYSLIPSICSIETDDIDTATQKICNFLIENGDLVNRNLVNTIETPSGTKDRLPSTVIDLSDSDEDSDGDLPNIMDLAHQLAGTKPNVPKMVKESAPTHFDHKQTNEEIHNMAEEGLINAPALDDPKPKKRKLKECTVVESEESFIDIGDSKVNVTREPSVESEKSGAVDGVSQNPDTDGTSASNIPNLNHTITDVDVLFECGCCFNENPFDYMVQCLDGHLFCCQCLERYAQEAVYGHGKGELLCMTGGCSEIFPNSQLSRALPFSLYKKYEERVSEECLNSACLENFVRCKFCGYGAELDAEQQFFTCTQCKKRFCRKCEELFQDHEGLKCEEVEKDGETKIRTDYEEKMAEAKIRTCGKCKSRFTKESGCNKITCRCSQTMCYICRKEKIDYTHFCQHPRSPNKGCNKCKACFLWSNADEDDKLAIEEIKKEALTMREKEGYQLPRQIGAPNEPEPPKLVKIPLAQPRRRRVAHRANHNMRVNAEIAVLRQEIEVARAAAANARLTELHHALQRPVIITPKDVIDGARMHVQRHNPPILHAHLIPRNRFPLPQNNLPNAQPHLHIGDAQQIGQPAPVVAAENSEAKATMSTATQKVATTRKPKPCAHAQNKPSNRIRDELISTAEIPLVQVSNNPLKSVNQDEAAEMQQGLIEINISQTTSPVKINNVSVTNIVNDPVLLKNRVSTNGMEAEDLASTLRIRGLKNQILEVLHTMDLALEYKNFDQIKRGLNAVKTIVKKI